MARSSDDLNTSYSFDALRGIQAGREFYVAMCPLKIIPKLFIFNEEEVSPQFRAQRILRDSRIPAIANYIVNNPKDYVFSSLTSSVDGAMKFVPDPSVGSDGKLGRLHISMESCLLINDGQHRRAAIEEALKVKPELGNESISVVFFYDKGLKRSQQMFSDLNKNAVKPTKSLGILYDHRNEFSKFIVTMSHDLEIFHNRTEMDSFPNSGFTFNASSIAARLCCPSLINKQDSMDMCSLPIFPSEPTDGSGTKFIAPSTDEVRDEKT